MWLLPDQGLGVVSLANGPSGHGFHELVVRKVVELLFEGARDLAAPRLEFQARQRREEIGRVRRGLNRSQEPAGPLIARLAGAYSNPDLGDVELGIEGAGGVFDVGEWKSSVDKVEDNAGHVALLLRDPPLAGLQLVVGGDEGRPTLSINYAQGTYVFERKEGSA